MKSSRGYFLLLFISFSLAQSEETLLFQWICQSIYSFVRLDCMLCHDSGNCELNPITIVHQIKYKKGRTEWVRTAETHKDIVYLQIAKIFDTIASASADTQNHLLLRMLFLCFCFLFFCLSVGCILPMVSTDFACIFLPKKKQQNISFNLQSRINYNTSVKIVLRNDRKYKWAKM